MLVQPSSLSLEGVARVPAHGREPPDAGFVTACREATGGNPFLVHALRAGLDADGIAPTRDATAHVASLGGQIVGRWMLMRLARLPEDAARMARAVAVLESATIPDAAELAGLDARRATAAADMLSGAGILAEGRPLGFAHAIVRSGVYHEISTADRARAHLQAARVLAARGAARERVAEHLLASEPTTPARSARRCRSASRSGPPESSAPARPEPRTSSGRRSTCSEPARIESSTPAR